MDTITHYVDVEYSPAELAAMIERETLIAMLAVVIEELGPRAVLQEVMQ